MLPAFAHAADQGWGGGDRGASYGHNQGYAAPTANAAVPDSQWNWYDDSYRRQHAPPNGQGSAPPSRRSGGTWSNPSSTAPSYGGDLRPDGRPWGELPSRYDQEGDGEYGYAPRGSHSGYEPPYYEREGGGYPPPRYRERWERGYGGDGREMNSWRAEPYGYEQDREPYGYPGGRRWRPDPYDPYGGGGGYGEGGGGWERPGRYDEPWSGGYGGESDYGYRGRRW